MKQAAYERILSVFEKNATTGYITQNKDWVTFTWKKDDNLWFTLKVEPSQTTLFNHHTHESVANVLSVEGIVALILRNI